MLTDVFLYLCSYVCGCVVLFDILFALYVYRSEHLLPKRVKQMRALLIAQMMNEQEARFPRDKIRRKLEKQLTHESWVKAFMICNTEFQHGFTACWRDCIRANLRMLESLLETYDRGIPEYKTLFARMIADLTLYECVDGADRKASGILQRMARTFARQMLDESAFLRQNAFRALVSLGGPVAVAEAFVTVNSKPVLINGKIMSDDLLAFRGDTARLISLLWACFPSFCPKLQTCMLDYFRLLPPKYARQTYEENIRKIMMDPAADSETRFAAIRYFRKHIYPAAYASLLELLDESGNHDANFAAVAATSLQGYPGKETERLLLRHLSDSDWYVRFNAADTLILLGVDYEKIVLESDDRYAKEMLIYRAEIAGLRGEGARGLSGA